MIKNRPRWMVACIVLFAAALEAATQEPSPRAFLDEYCVGCHNQKLKTAGLLLDTIDVTQVAAAAETWEKVVRKLRVGMMPPAGARRPGDSARNNFASWLETQLDRSAAASPNPGRPALH